MRSSRITGSFINLDVPAVRQVASVLGRIAAELWLRDASPVEHRPPQGDNNHEQE
jgi:hypothetical protein